MTQSKKQNKALISISSIKVMDFVLHTSIYRGPKKINRDLFRFNISGAHKLIPKSKTIAILTKIDILYKKKTQTKPQVICNLKTEIEFEFKNYLRVIKKTGGKTFVPQDLIEKLFGTSIATSRGIMFVKLSGTIFEKIYMPPVDTQNFLKK